MGKYAKKICVNTKKLGYVGLRRLPDRESDFHFKSNQSVAYAGVAFV